MKQLWHAFRLSLGDFREELFLLMIANMIWIAGALPGILLLGYSALLLSLPLFGLGLLALIPFPLVTMGLFRLIAAVSRRESVGWKRMASEAWQVKNAGYLWLGINLPVLLVLVGNIRFYADPDSPWGGGSVGMVVTATFAALTFLWLLWQLFALAAFARMERPRLAIGFRQAANFIARQPGFAVSVGIAAILLTIISIIIPVLGLWAGFALIGLLANRAIEPYAN